MLQLDHVQAAWQSLLGHAGAQGRCGETAGEAATAYESPPGGHPALVGSPGRVYDDETPRCGPREKSWGTRVLFAYYDRLTRAQQRVYRQSDAITSLRLAAAPTLRSLIEALSVALSTENRAQVEAAAQRLYQGLTQAFGVPPCRLEVLSARPHGRWGELQGLYTPGARGRPPKVTLWMRTARQKRVVAFRTFLRTLLHELGHHLDYAYLRLPDSFHTEGFYKRESSLFHQLVPESERSPAPARPAASAPE